MIDRKSFIEENFQILDFDTQQPVPFSFKPVQTKYYGLLMQDYPNLEGVRELLLKARQEGFSSFVLALFAVDFIFIPYSISICVSHRKDATEMLFTKVKFYLESYCRKNGMDIKEYLKTDNKGIIESRHKHSVFYIQTAGAKVGGRGGSARNIHFCLSGNQLVIGRNGFVSQIKDTPLYVRDGNGSLIKVFDISERISPEDMLRLTIAGSPNLPIDATLSHKLLCREGKDVAWKQAKDITTDDYIAFPLTNSIRNNPQALPLRLRNMKVLLTEDFGELCGWYLAEGCFNTNRIDLAVNLPELEYVINIVGKNKDLFKSYSVYKRKTHADISIFGIDFALFMVELLGQKSYKAIRDQFWLYGKPFLVGLLRGLFLGDGCNKTRGIVTFASTRPQLVVQLKRLLISMRIGYPQISIEKANTRSERNNNEVWKIILSGKGATRLRKLLGFPVEEREDGRESGYNKFFREGEKYYFAKVRKIESIPREEFVYDIVLDKDPHSFCLVPGVSSNSETAFYQDTDLITASEIVEGTAQQVPQGKGMIFIESTANGVDNYYQKQWERSADGKSEYKNRFFGWQEFYTKEYVDKKKKSFATEAKFKQEFPGSPEEAFIASGTPFFDNLILEEMRKKKAQPVLHGRLAPDGEFL